LVGALREECKCGETELCNNIQAPEASAPTEPPVA